MWRVQGLPVTFAVFITAIAVWFQSVIVSARAVVVVNATSTPIAAAMCFMIALSVSNGIRNE